MENEPIMTSDDRSVSPALQLDSPELVTAIEIEQWADRHDARGAFPELMRRLLEQTEGITNLEVRAHEGVDAPGWDATAYSTGSTYLPAGKLCFELGTSKDVKRKADEDYKKRVKESTGDPDSRIFVFATPRNWPSGQRWAEERRRERKFANVKVIDAHTIEGWLQATPPIHYWLSERLGRKPREVQTLQAWWATFQQNMNIGIPSQFFRAGRDEQAQKLIAELSRKCPAGSVAVSSGAAEDILAFVHATLLVEERSLLERAVVVNDRDSWARLAESDSPMVLIPRFSNPDVTSTTMRRHRVLELIDGTAYSKDEATIELPKIGRQEAAESLRGASVDLRKVNRMAALARRSMTAFIRSVSCSQSLQKPAWLCKADTISVLAPLVLIGAWQDNYAGDKELIEDFIGQPEIEIRRLLTSLSEQSDPPFIRSGPDWRLVDPVDAARLLLPKIETETEIIERWQALVCKALLASDPYGGMKTSERLAAQIRGVKPKYSETLHQHVAEGLVLATTSSSKLAERARHIVMEVLATALADATGNTLIALSRVLPLLAEAAPEEFLEAVSDNISAETPVILALFRESSADDLHLGPSSQRHHLQWALERLCWSNEYYGSAAMLLAALAVLDPNDSRSGSPFESLHKVTAGWLNESGASMDEKIDVVRATIKRYPKVGWHLVQELLQPNRSFVVSESGPRFRDWELPYTNVTYDEFSRYNRKVLQLATEMAGQEAQRWCELVKLIHHLAGEDKTVLIQSVSSLVRSETSSWSVGERQSVWRALKTEVASHEAHPNAGWAASESDLELLRQAVELLDNSEDPVQFVHLFGRTVDLEVSGLRWRDDGFKAALDVEQRRAVDELSKRGVAAVRWLATHVETPELVGISLADADSLDATDVVSWLRESEDSELQCAARAYVSVSAHKQGVCWVRELFDRFSSEFDVQRMLIAATPMEARFWKWVGTLSDELVSDYWRMASFHRIPDEEREEAVELLIEHSAAWRALDVIEPMLHSDVLLDATMVKSLLNACLTTPRYRGAQQDYVVSELLKWLESTVPGDADLPLLEFYFFNFVGSYGPSNALYRTLSRSPEFFVVLVSLAYGREAEPVGVFSRTEVCQRLAWSVLYNWSKLPGLREGGLIDASHLSGWVKECRALFEECDLVESGDYEIGKVLATSPDGDDGVWPAEVVRDIVQDLKSPDVELGLVTGRCNQRGASVRGVYDGGKQERGSARSYREAAKQVQIRWPRTARVLRRIADEYEQIADHLDELDERRADGD